MNRKINVLLKTILYFSVSVMLLSCSASYTEKEIEDNGRLPTQEEGGIGGTGHADQCTGEEEDKDKCQ